MTGFKMLTIFTFISTICLVATADVCPCGSPDLCHQIRQERDFEVFVFDVGRKAWQSYDWSIVTTVAAFGKYDPELMCYAHSKGARVVLKGDVFLPYIVDPGNRTAWITEKVNLAKTQFLDGINIDIEHAVEAGSAEYHALTGLVKESTEAFHREIPGSQVSFDVAWSPNCIDKRCYDYVTIAESCDLLFVMSYDEQSQIPGDCIAMANAPVTQTLKGYYQYLDLEIDPKKLVMGVPWYGYDYSCLNLSKDGVCSIEKIPFRGAPCSDAAGKQKTYSWIMKQVNSSMTGRLWDQGQQAPYFNYEDHEGQIHQVWYDDPESICLKASLVKSKGLRGIGVWNGNLLNYTEKIEDCDGSNSEEEDDAEAALKKEVAQLKKKGKGEKRFQALDSGANNVVFIRTHNVEPDKLVHHVLSDLHATKKNKSRNILRMLPVSGTCKAFQEDMDKYLITFLEPWFKPPNHATFQIAFKARNSSHNKRDDIIKAVAGLVGKMNPENKVDLTNPELTIIVEVIKTVCCLSVVPDYALYRKYNLQEVVKEDAPKADAADKRADQKATDQGDSADVVKAEEQTDKQAEDIKVPENDKLVEAATEDKK